MNYMNVINKICETLNSLQTTDHDLIHKVFSHFSINTYNEDSMMKIYEVEINDSVTMILNVLYNDKIVNAFIKLIVGDKICDVGNVYVDDSGKADFIPFIF